MARIAGINIPTKKRVEIALTYIHGIGTTSARSICNKAGITQERRINDLTEDELSKLRDIIDADYLVEGDLRRKTSMDVKRYLDLGCLRGLRHRRNLVQLLFSKIYVEVADLLHQRAVFFALIAVAVAVRRCFRN